MSAEIAQRGVSLQRQPRPVGSEHVRQTQGPRHARLMQLAAAANRTGLPDRLKAGVESLSGVSLDAVRVHYNSPMPKQLHALAYAQGSEIHLAPGQERHLPHEAWHVVQQAQGRVRPTMMLKRGVAINDDRALESEADRMGASALSLGSSSVAMPTRMDASRGREAVMQGVLARNPVFGTGVDAVALSDPAKVRLQHVLNLLGEMLDRRRERFDLIVTVEGARSFVGDNPASVNVEQHRDHTGVCYDINIDLRRAFAEKATTGELLGLLTHEIGAHPLPDIEQEQIGSNDTNLHVLPEILGAAPRLAWTDGGQTRDRHGRQHDHLLAANILAVRPQLLRMLALIGLRRAGLAPRALLALRLALHISQRARSYFQTMLNVGDRLYAARATNPTHAEDASRLVHLYAFDIARILGTDDQRLSILRNAFVVGGLYQQVFRSLILPERARHPWIPAEAPRSNTLTLVLSFVAFYARIKFEELRRG